MKIAFLLYPVRDVKIAEDSSFWIMRELQKRGHQVYYFESGSLEADNTSPKARLTPARLDRSRGYRSSRPQKSATPLIHMDCIFIRKEPPFDTQYLYALQILDRIKNRVFIANDPRGMMAANEKTFVMDLAPYSPDSFFTQNAKAAYEFIRKSKKPAIVKPLDDKGGKGVLLVQPNDRNLPSLLELATQNSQKSVLVQEFLLADKYGDRRLLVLDGEILGAFLRKPSKNDFRANLSAGGSMHPSPVTAQDKKLVQSISKKLSGNGLYLVGLDLIGNFITEVNVTSPAGVPEIHQYKRNYPEKKIANFIERMSADRKRF